MNSGPLNPILAQLFQGLLLNGANNNIQELITAIEKLTAAINDLPHRLMNANVSVLNANNNNIPFIATNYEASYSDKLKSNTNNNKINVNNNVCSNLLSNNKQSNMSVLNNVSTQDSSMAKIVELKNQRNDAFYKYKRNQIIANNYENNLFLQPQRIPKKFAPNINKNDSNDLIDHKISIALQTVQNEIQTLRIHENIQKNKMENFDKKVKQAISDKNCNINEKENQLKKYNIIINRYDENTTRRLNEKSAFFNSPQHTICLNFKKRNDNNVNNDSTSIALHENAQQCSSSQPTTTKKRPFSTSSDSDEVPPPKQSTCLSQPSPNSDHLNYKRVGTRARHKSLSLV